MWIRCEGAKGCGGWYDDEVGQGPGEPRVWCIMDPLEEGVDMDEFLLAAGLLTGASLV